MKKQALLFLLIIIISPTVFAQTIQKVWGKKYMSPVYENLNFHSEKVIPDNQGNVIIAGESADSLSNTPALRIIKLDSSGTVLWQFSHLYYQTILRNTRFHNTNSNWVNTLTVDASNNIYVAYSTEDSLTTSILRWCIMKISPGGNIIWDKMYTGQYGNAAYPIAIKVDDNGNVYTTGMGNDSNIDDNAMVTIKLNSSGVLQWDMMMDGNAVDNGNTTSAGMDIVLDNNANVYVTGHLANYDTMHHFDLALVKYSSAGALLWSKVIDDTSGMRWQLGERVFLNNSGDIIVCGYNSSYYQNFYNDILLLKFNPAGNVIWKKTFNKNIDEVIQDMDLDNSGNIVVASKMKYFFGQPGYSGQLAKFSGATGDSVWTYSTASVTDWLPTGIAVGSNDDVYLWGIEEFNLPYAQSRLIAIDAAGSVTASIYDTAINYQFSSLQSQNIISVNNGVYAIAWFINQSTFTTNGLLVRFTTVTPADVSDKKELCINVYPNPFNDNFVLSVPNKEQTALEIRIYNFEGKEVLYDRVANNFLHINAMAWQQGIYFVKVKSAKHTQSYKIIKN